MTDIVDFNLLKRGKSDHNVCKCNKWKQSFIVDEEHHSVHCNNCGNRVEPFDALMSFVYRFEEYQHASERYREILSALNEDTKKARRRRLKTGAAKEIEDKFINPKNHNKLYPICPCCDESFDILEIVGSGRWNPVIEQKIKERMKKSGKYGIDES